LLGHQAGEVVAARHHQLRRLGKELAPFHPGQPRPAQKSASRGLHGLLRLGWPAIGYLRDHVLGRRIHHVKGLSTLRAHPAPIDIELPGLLHGASPFVAVPRTRTPAAARTTITAMPRVVAQPWRPSMRGAPTWLPPGFRGLRDL